MGYPTTITTFATKAAGATIEAAHVNDLQTEVTALETDLLTGATPAELRTGKIAIASQAAADLIYAASATQLGRLPLTALQSVRKNAANNALEAYSTGVVTLTDGATPALDASLGSVFYLDAAGGRTIAVPSNPTAGQKIIIIHYANGGARTLALNTGANGFAFGSDITALTATASGKVDVIGAVWHATVSKWYVVAVVKGY